MTARKTITAEQAVLALKSIGLSRTAKAIAEHMEKHGHGGVDSRAVATAMRAPCADGRVTITYRKNVGWYRFKRLTAAPTAAQPGVE